MSLKNILSQSSFWMVNKTIAKYLNSVESALLLSDLLDKHSYYWANNDLIKFKDDDYFFATSEKIQESTTLSYKVQKKCIKILIDKELIQTKLAGVPAKLHFSICENKIWQIVNSSSYQKSKLELPKSKNVNNNIYKEINNKKENNIKEREKLFYNELLEYKNEYSKETLREFYDYWSEPNKSKTKMKFELKQTWDISRRLKAWARNNFNSNKGFNNPNEIPESQTPVIEFKEDIK